jgi:hypothetical protein
MSTLSTRRNRCFIALILPRIMARMPSTGVPPKSSSQATHRLPDRPGLGEGLAVDRKDSGSVSCWPICVA